MKHPLILNSLLMFTMALVIVACNQPNSALTDENQLVQLANNQTIDPTGTVQNSIAVCRDFIDENGNGICDLYEQGLCKKNCRAGKAHLAPLDQTNDVKQSSTVPAQQQSNSPASAIPTESTGLQTNSIIQSGCRHGNGWGAGNGKGYGKGSGRHHRIGWHGGQRQGYGHQCQRRNAGQHFIDADNNGVCDHRQQQR